MVKNYLTNPGFETKTGPLQSPWKFTPGSSTQWKTSDTEVKKGSTYAYSDSNGFQGYSSERLVTMSLEQEVTIPANVKVKVGLMFKALRSSNSNGNPFIVNLKIDGTAVPLKVDGVTATDYKPSSSSWKALVPASNSYFGGSVEAKHKITLYVSSSIQNSQDIFVADDFFITPITGPNGLPLCST
ncbi:hypothetical protein BKA63DRAFT_563361 [Paraphoma chrysanthemicola]|nr:hypothetical protein BKA63DRAFT_563361 [Paraphoma chrysanthemicola]